MKRSIYLGLIVLITVSLSSCETYNYYTAGLNTTNMSRYHSFAWMPMGSGKGKAPGNVVTADAKIKDATTSALEAKGLSISQKQPDLLISYTTTVGRGTRTNYYTNYGWGGYGWGGWGGWGGYGWGGYGLGWGFGGRGYGWGGFSPYYYYGAPFAYGGALTYEDQEHYKEGTLIIDMIDRRTRKVVWRGYGVGEVHHDAQKNIDDLPKEVNGIISQLSLQPPAGAPVSMRRTRTMSS
jgi:hypothetical protein